MVAGCGRECDTMFPSRFWKIEHHALMTRNWTMSLGALTFRIFANRFWAHLPREVQIMISRGHAVVYETTLSRLFIPPYIWFQFGSFRALRRFRPANGARHYRSFQDFFVRRLAEEVRPDGEFVWPCDGLLCESAPVTREFVVEVKGEARHVSAVFGPPSNFLNWYCCRI
ncbi:hypothetical protein EBZ80_26890 [bacterium]|nr:hypothetical protein [bacterium]